MSGAGSEYHWPSRAAFLAWIVVASTLLLPVAGLLIAFFAWHLVILATYPAGILLGVGPGRFELILLVWALIAAALSLISSLLNARTHRVQRALWAAAGAVSLVAITAIPLCNASEASQKTGRVCHPFNAGWIALAHLRNPRQSPAPQK